jgi:hypothetical protein
MSNEHYCAHPFNWGAPGSGAWRCSKCGQWWEPGGNRVPRRMTWRRAREMEEFYRRAVVGTE